MAEIDALVVKLEAQNAELISALKDSQKQTQVTMKNMQDAVEQFTTSANKNVSRFDQIMNVFAGTTLANVVAKGAELASQAIQAFGSQLMEGIKEASEYDQTLTQLANSLAASGQYSQQAMAGLQGWIDAAEEATGVDDGLIAKNLQLLSSLTRLDAEGLQRAQQAALDLSSALGMDLGTATSLIAKAANGNVEAFKRYGITLQSTGNKTVDFANALATLESRFGGAAAGSMKTFQGSLTSLQNSFGDVFKAIGSVITSNPIIIAGIQKMSEVFSGLKDYVEGNAQALSDGLSNALIMATRAGAIFLDVISNLWTPLRLLYEGIMVVVQGIVDLVQAAGALKNFDLEGAKNAFNEVGERVQNVNRIIDGETTNSFAKMRDGLIEFGNTAEDQMNVAKAASESVLPTIEIQKEQIQELTEIEKARLEQAKAFGQEMINLATSVNGAYELQQQTIQTAYESELMTFESFKAAKLASQLDQFEQERLLLEQSQLTKEQMAMAETALGQKQAAERFKLLEDLKKQEENNNKMRLQGFSSFFGNLASLQQTSSKELAAIGKAAAIAQATINMYEAISGAFKVGSNIGGPVVGAAFAAAAGAAQAVNISKIAGVGLRSGIDSVPGVGRQDNFPAVLAPGERVVPSETNKDLTEFLQKQQSNMTPQPVFNLNFYGPVWSDKASAGADIVEAINEAMARGMTLRFLAT